MGRKRRPSFEKIEYEPRSVKDLLTEMKDTSELVIDLAYASILFDSENMANQVQSLEEKMDKLLYHIRLNALMAARSVEDAEQLAGILQVANAAESISNAAGDIADIINTDKKHRAFLSRILADADEKTAIATIKPDSSLAGKSIKELGVESETGARIIAVRRPRGWVYDPDDHFILSEGDQLVLIGVEDGYRYIQECAEGKRQWGDE